MQGIWVEPPEDLVLQLRDELTVKLANISRDAPDWTTYRAWQLLAHLVSKSNSQDLRSYKEEVHATRKVREKLKLFDSKIIIENAKLASEILHSYDLDGRVIKSDLSIKSESNYIKGFLGLAIMLLCSPITIYSTGIQIFLAWYLGNNTDERAKYRKVKDWRGIIKGPWIHQNIIETVKNIKSKKKLTGGTKVNESDGYCAALPYFLYGYDFNSLKKIISTELAKFRRDLVLKNLLENLEPMLDALK